MKEYRKWYYEKHEYLPYLVPEDKKLCLLTEDMDEIVNCCQCLKDMAFGDSYTSMEVHNAFGLGYAVCESCYDKEWERRKKYKED